MMDQWATDTFYSHFPSYSSGEDSRRNLWNKCRQNEYNQFTRITSERFANKRAGNDVSDESNTKQQDESMIQSIKKKPSERVMQLENDILNEEFIKQRNRRAVEVR